MNCYCESLEITARKMLYHFAACQMQNTCPQHSNCKDDGNTYKCECKKGFIPVDDECIGTYDNKKYQ